MSRHEGTHIKRGGQSGHGGPPGTMPVEKAKDFKGTLGRLLRYLKSNRVKIIAACILAAFSTVFTIVGPKILALATDEISSGVFEKISGGAGTIDLHYIAAICVMLIGVYTLASLFSMIQGFIMARVATDVTRDLRRDIMGKINRLPIAFFNRASHGDVLSRITNDVDTLSQSLQQSLAQLITSIATLLGVLIMMFSISWQMTLIALLIIPVSTLLVSIIVRFSQKQFKAQQKYLGSINGQVEEMYGGHVIIKTYNGERKALEDFDGDNEKLYKASWKAQFLSGLMQPVMNFVGNVGYVLICVVGAALAAGGSMTIGGIQAFIQYVRSFTQPIVQLANISNQLQSTIAASERVFEFLDEKEEDPGKTREDLADKDVEGNIRFEHIAFGYEDSEKTVIKDFSLDVRAGVRIAIVGPTGAGKTTLVKLLMRFHELRGGAIYLDGNDISDYSRKKLRESISMVLQDAWLYNGTIMENIRYGRPDATDEEVITAAKMSQVHRFITTLPDGYDTVMNEEATNVSQGQKQLLTIARAMLAGGKVLILDEATSSVDTRTEVAIQRAMNNLMQGRTSFIIAHRLSTIRDADMILFLKDGDVVEQGTHDELMAKGGYYAEMYMSQFAIAAS